MQTALLIGVPVAIGVGAFIVLRNKDDDDDVDPNNAEPKVPDDADDDDAPKKVDTDPIEQLEKIKQEADGIVGNVKPTWFYEAWAPSDTKSAFEKSRQEVLQDWIAVLRTEDVNSAQNALVELSTTYKQLIRPITIMGLPTLSDTQAVYMRNNGLVARPNHPDYTHLVQMGCAMK